VFDKWGGADLLDGKRIVRPLESVTWTRRLVDECGIFAGVSTGAAVAGAAKVAERLEPGEEATIVVISADGGWKYLSTGIYSASIDEAARIAETVSTW